MFVFVTYWVVAEGVASATGGPSGSSINAGSVTLTTASLTVGAGDTSAVNSAPNASGDVVSSGAASAVASSQTAVPATASQQHAVPQQMTPEQMLEARYQALMIAVEDIGRDIKPAYAGSRAAMERLKKGE